MVQIPGGEFLMGSHKDNALRKTYEYPAIGVTVPPFFMGKYEVTQAQWMAIARLPRVIRDLNPEPSYFKGDGQLPVESVSWLDAKEACRRLSNHTGRNYRLPSEAEWEYACRAGTTTPFHFGKAIYMDLANYCGIQNPECASKSKIINAEEEALYKELEIETNGVFREKTTVVGSFPANPFGLYDMHGNVVEWCQDTNSSVLPDSYGNDSPRDGSARIDRSHEWRIARGGPWSFPANGCRSASRHSVSFDFAKYSNLSKSFIGFRVVCTAFPK